KPRKLEGLQDQPLPCNRSRIGMRDLVKVDQMALIRFLVNVVTGLMEALNDIVHSVMKSLIFLEGQTFFSFQAGLHMSGELPPLPFGDIKVLSEVEQGHVSGDAVNASGFQEGVTAILFAVFEASGSCSDEHVRRGLVIWCDTFRVGGGSKRQHRSTTKLFCEKNREIWVKTHEFGAKSALLDGKMGKMSTEISNSSNGVAKMGYGLFREW
ncbi:MAG: hypothetical protein OXD43_16020, partial [Bacteroidetes bacterium]|nr:hypothetical protein [Bacteroidota bacterium]